MVFALNKKNPNIELKNRVEIDEKNRILGQDEWIWLDCGE